MGKYFNHAFALVAVAGLAASHDASAQTCTNSASGACAWVAGLNNEASGQGSVAMGQGNVASGTYSATLNSNNQATAPAATAMGAQTEARGTQSVAMGGNTLANSYLSLAIGRYNVGAGAKNTWSGGDPLFEIGNGTSSSTNNAFTVLKNGNVGIDTAEPEVSLHILDGSDVKLAAGGYIQFGATGTLNIAIDNNEIMARDDGAAAPLHLQYDGGQVRVGGEVVHSSDRRLKQNVAPTPYGLREILELRPVSYEWKHRDNPRRSIGFIAQDVRDVLPELVDAEQDPKGMLSVNYVGVIPVLVNAVSELSRENERLHADVAAQSAIWSEQLDRYAAQEVRLDQLSQAHAAQQNELRELRALVQRLSETHGAAGDR